MSGWFRIWVVCCALFTLVPMYLYHTLIPSDEQLNLKHQQWIDQQLDEIRIIEGPVVGPNRLLREVLMQTPVSERLASIEQTKAQHLEFMSRVSKQRPLTIMKLIGGWVALCGLVYAVGFVIAWIGKGFRKPQAQL